MIARDRISYDGPLHLKLPFEILFYAWRVETKT